MATRWALFAGGTIVVLLGVLWLARASARLLRSAAASDSTQRDASGDDRRPADIGATAGADRQGVGPFGSRTALLANVAVSQVLLVFLLAGLVWYANVPIAALGLDSPRSALIPGLAFGAVLYVGAEIGVTLLERAGHDVDETLRELLTPDELMDWALLLGVVLPVVAVGEELLFRGALIGALSVGVSVSPWLLVVVSAIAFGLGHGVQGRGGVVITGALGLVLGIAFVLTERLGLVIVAHYVVNALEFLGPALRNVLDL